MPHLHRDIDFTVDVYIVYQDTVLLRLHEKYHKWLVPGGHIELDETPPDAAIREVKEETGLDVELYKGPTYMDTPHDHGRDLIPPMHLNIHDIPGLPHRHQHISFVYFATAQSNSINPQLASDRSDDCLWLTREEVMQKKNLSEQTRGYALHALDILTRV